MRKQTVIFATILIVSLVCPQACGTLQRLRAPEWQKAVYLPDFGITLRWVPVKEAAAYRILRSTIPGSGYEKVCITASRKYYDRAVELNTKYYYVVQSLSGKAESRYSSEVSVETPRFRVPSKVQRPPEKLWVRGEHISEIGEENWRVSIKWKSVPGATGYRVFRNDEIGEDYGKDYKEIGAVKEKSTSEVIDEIGRYATNYFIDTVRNDREYRYRVKAFNSGNETGFSRPAKFFPKSSPYMDKPHEREEDKLQEAYLRVWEDNDDDALNVLKGALHDKELKVRIRAARLLMYLGLDAGHELLLQNLSCAPDLAVYLDQERVVDRVIEMLEQSEPGDCRVGNVALWLGSLPPEKVQKAVPLLKELANKGNRRNRLKDMLSRIQKSDPDGPRYPNEGVRVGHLRLLAAVLEERIKPSQIIGYILVRGGGVVVAGVTDSSSVDETGRMFTFTPSKAGWGFAGEAASERKVKNSDFKITDLKDFIPAIETWLPTARILSITISSPNYITVNTGYVRGRLWGRGNKFLFEKKDGIWVVTRRTNWIS